VAKSAFGLYAVFRAASEDRTVIYDSRENGQVMFKDGKAYALPSNIATLDEFNDSEALYVCDGKEPVARKRVCTLLISSPGTEDTKWFELSKSEKVRAFTIPAFTDEEMHELHALDFATKAGCSDLEVATRMRKWGNNPRNVFTQAPKDQWQGELETAASSLDLPALLKQLQRHGGLRAFTGKDVRHRLLNMVPKRSLLGSDLTIEDPTYYVFDHCELPSVYVEERYAWHLLRTQREGLHSFLRGGRGHVHRWLSGHFIRAGNCYSPIAVWWTRAATITAIGTLRCQLQASTRIISRHFRPALCSAASLFSECQPAAGQVEGRQGRAVCSVIQALSRC
jgi:hypothetical protein